MESNSRYFPAYVLIDYQADEETHLFQEFTQAVTAEAHQATTDKAKLTLKINEKVFSIHRETKHLEIIKDVRDELNMILMILRDQAKAVEECEDVSDKSVSTNNSIYVHESEIEQLDHRAEKVYTAVSVPVEIMDRN